MELNDPLTLSLFIASFIVLIVYVRRTVNIDNGWLSPPDQLGSSRIRKTEGLALCFDVCERERGEVGHLVLFLPAWRFIITVWW